VFVCCKGASWEYGMGRRYHPPHPTGSGGALSSSVGSGARPGRPQPKMNSVHFICHKTLLVEEKCNVTDDRQTDRPRYEEMCHNRQNRLHCKKWFRLEMLHTWAWQPVINITPRNVCGCNTVPMWCCSKQTFQSSLVNLATRTTFVFDDDFALHCAEL